MIARVEPGSSRRRAPAESWDAILFAIGAPTGRWNSPLAFAVDHYHELPIPDGVGFRRPSRAPAMVDSPQGCAALRLRLRRGSTLGYIPPPLRGYDVTSRYNAPRLRAFLKPRAISWCCQKAGETVSLVALRRRLLGFLPSHSSSERPNSSRPLSAAFPEGGAMR